MMQITREESGLMDDDVQKLEIVKDIAHESMQQEKDRSALVQSKAQNLIKYISTTIGVVNAILVFLLDREFINQCRLIWMAIIADCPLVLSLFLAVAAQILMKALYYPSGIQMLTDISKVEPRGMQLVDYEIYRMRCMKEYTESLCKVNDKRAKLVKWSYMIYLVGLLLILGEGIVSFI